jgi:hypothetical protein
VVSAVVLYGFETWFHIVRVLENRVLRSISGGRKEREAGEICLGLYNTYSSPNIFVAVKSV